jgi:branched-chain amino acid transport system permease protein
MSARDVTSPLSATPPAAPVAPAEAGSTVVAPAVRTGGLGPFLAALVLLALAPFVLDPSTLGTLARILYFALLAASLGLLIGTAGLPSLAHAAYFGVGAYTAGLLAKHVTEIAVAQLLGAAVVAAVAAALSGWLAIRARDIFFLMITLAIGQIFFQFAETSEGLTGGANGLFGLPAVQAVPGTGLTAPADVYWFVLAGFAIGYAVLRTVVRSPFGLALQGIRDNEARMRALGYPTLRYKYAAYCIAGAVAGLAGALLMADQRLVTPADAGFTTAVVALVAVIIGGSGTLWGPCLGAAVVVIVRDELGPSLGGHGPLVLGLVFVVTVYLLPGGIAGLVTRLRGQRA